MRYRFRNKIVLTRAAQKYGMKDLPANAGVEISTNPEQERKAYDIQGAIDATAQYRRIAPFLPVGFIYGALRDVV